MKTFLSTLVLLLLLTIFIFSLMNSAANATFTPINNTGEMIYKKMKSVDSWLAPKDSNEGVTSSGNNSDPCPRFINCDRSDPHLITGCRYN